jgi:hypothetical protein
MAFALPICTIVLCYARIFYIVRKTAMKTHEIHPKANGSLRLSHNHVAVINSDSRVSEDKSDRQRLSIQTEDGSESHSERSKSSFISNHGQRPRKLLSKMREDDLKFIDTSVESDLPPTLSRLQRKSVQISIEQPSISSPTTATTIISSELNSINQDANGSANNQQSKRSHDNRELAVDSAVGESPISSFEQVTKRRKKSLK